MVDIDGLLERQIDPNPMHTRSQACTSKVHQLVKKKLERLGQWRVILTTRPFWDHDPFLRAHLRFGGMLECSAIFGCAELGGQGQKQALDLVVIFSR